MVFGNVHKLPMNAEYSYYLCEPNMRPSSHVRNNNSLFDFTLNHANALSLTACICLSLDRPNPWCMYLSRLDYGIASLTGLAHEHSHKLQLVQSTAARINTSTPRREYTKATLNWLHWLPIG